MIKKASILTLLLLFFVSTTGIPLTIHICNMMDNEVSSTCPVPDKEMQEIHQSCKQVPQNNNVFSTEKRDCCKTEVADKSISDNFLQIDNQKHNLKLKITTIIISVADISNDSPVITSNYFTDTSPPALINNHIYLSNSVLII